MRVALACIPLLLSACAHSPVDEPLDPLEPFNRSLYDFNTTVDTYVARPVTKQYVRWVPPELRLGIGNFLSNITYPTVIVNDVLQGKFAQAGSDTTRFLLNTTFGLAGFLDPATLVGLSEHDEDFGQTLGYWGLGPGWYLMVPFIGPSTNRDLVGRAINSATNPITYMEGTYALPVNALDVLDKRAGLLGVEGMLSQQFDEYAFVRSAFLQRRLGQVYDGHPPEEEEVDYGE